MNSNATWIDRIGLGEISWIMCNSVCSSIFTCCAKAEHKWDIENLEAVVVAEGLFGLISRVSSFGPL